MSGSVPRRAERCTVICCLLYTSVPDNKQERFQALHHQFVASAEAVRYAHDHYPQFKMGCMLCFITSYALTCDPADEKMCIRDRTMVIPAFIICTITGILFGIIAAKNRGKTIDSVISFFANIGVSMPMFRCV